MAEHIVVTKEEWTAARIRLLAREKELTRLRDDVSQERRDLPWVKVDKQYVFDGPNGKETLSDLFNGRTQLLVYHFMFDPGWSEGCKSCSFWRTTTLGSSVTWRRDVTMVTVSKAPLSALDAFSQRMGWRFKWVSSFGSDFNRDFHVSFTAEERQGVDGQVYHTYSCYARGLDALNGAYQWLDLVPKGRDEDALPYTMAWVRHHDRYEEAPVS